MIFPCVSVCFRKLVFVSYLNFGAKKSVESLINGYEHFFPLCQKRKEERSQALLLYVFAFCAKKPQAQFFTIPQLLPGHGAGYENCSLQLELLIERVERSCFYHPHPCNMGSFYSSPLVNHHRSWNIIKNSQEKEEESLFMIWFMNAKIWLKKKMSSSIMHSVVSSICHNQMPFLKMSMKCI